MIYILLWLLVGMIPFWALWCALNWLAYKKTYPYLIRSRTFCEPVTPETMFFAFLGAWIWPVTLILAFIAWITVLIVRSNDSGFWQRPLFNPCDLFKRRK